jgi:hypothetical protein
MVDINDMKIKDVSLETLKSFVASKETEEFDLKTAETKDIKEGFFVKNKEGNVFACIFNSKFVKEDYFGWFDKSYIPEGYEPKLVDDGRVFIDIKLEKKK